MNKKKSAIAEKIIENDEDTREEDGISENGLYPYDPTEFNIDLKEDPQSVFQYMRKYEKGELITNPEYQRHLVWKIEQKSRFIESCIIGFPLPPFYVNQRTDGKLVIIDGLQRTNALYEYIKEEKYALTGLEAMPKLNDKKFSELDQKYQTAIEDKKLFFYILKPSVPSKVVYDLFNRINTGGTQLNRQEVRNCIFKGKSTVLLAELANQPYFKRAIDNGISPQRMKDQEAVLRFLAFFIQGYSNYKNDMSDFLEKAMVIINKMEEKEIADLKEIFKHTMYLTHNFFGKENFRYPTDTSRGVVNMAILETISYFFAKQSRDYLEKNQVRIKKNYEKLLSDPKYKKAVRSSTGTSTNVKDRFEKAMAILGDIL